MPKLYRFLEAPEHILAGDEIWSQRDSEWCAVSPAFIDTEYSAWIPPIRRAAAPQSDQGGERAAFAVWRDRFPEIVEDERLREAWDEARTTASQATQRLDKKAQVGGARFGVGIKWSTVIEAAQRHHEYMNTPEKEAERIAQARVLADFVRGRAAVPQAEATLTDEQRADIQKVIDCLEPDDWCGDESIMAVLNRVLATHPTEQHASDDARDVPGNCHKCGLPKSANPHPEDGKPGHYLSAGCPTECIPCLSKSRHGWAQAAMKDAKDAERYRWLRGQQWDSSNLFVVAGGRSAVRLGVDCPSDDRLDEAIDAARAGGPDAR